MAGLISTIGSLIRYKEMFVINMFLLGGRLISSFIMGYFTARIAKEKGYHFTKWFVLGFICDIPALIYMAVIHKKENIDLLIEKECPECKELIKEKATKCRFCGHEFDSDYLVEE